MSTPSFNDPTKRAVTANNATQTKADYDISHELRPDISTLRVDLTAETSRAQSAETLLTNNLSTETVRAQSAETVLTQNLSSEVVRAQSVETLFTTNLDTEISRATSAETQALFDAKAYTDAQLTNLLGANVNSALSQLQSLGEALGDDSVQSTILEHLQDVNNAISIEISRATAAEETLTFNLNSEVTRAQSRETAINNYADSISLETSLQMVWTKQDLSTEIVRAQSAESVLSSRITTETTNRQNGDASLELSLSSEVARAGTAEFSLESRFSTAIANETSRAIGKEWSLEGRLSAEESRAMAFDTLINNNLNDEIARAQSAETVLTNDLSSEVSNRTAAVASARADFSTALAGAISTEVIDRNNAIDAAITTEVANRDAAILVAKNQATAYTDTSISTEIIARDGAIAVSLSNAKAYADQQDESYLILAKAYALDQANLEKDRAMAAETSLEIKINATNTTVSNNYTTLDSKIDSNNSAFADYKDQADGKFDAIEQAFTVIFDAFSVEKYPGSAPDYYQYTGSTQSLSGSPAGAPAGAPADYSSGSWQSPSGYSFTRNTGTSASPIYSPTTGNIVGTGVTTGTTVVITMMTGFPFTVTSPTFVLEGKTFTYTLEHTRLGATTTLPGLTYTPAANETGTHYFQLKVYEGATFAAVHNFTTTWNTV